MGTEPTTPCPFNKYKQKETNMSTLEEIAKRANDAIKENDKLTGEFIENKPVAEYAAAAVEKLWGTIEFLCKNNAKFPVFSHACIEFKDIDYGAPTHLGGWVYLNYDHVCGYYAGRPDIEGNYCGMYAEQTPDYYRTNRWTAKGWNYVKKQADESIKRAEYYVREWERHIAKLEEENKKIRGVKN